MGVVLGEKKGTELLDCSELGGEGGSEEKDSQFVGGQAVKGFATRRF